MSEFVRKAVFSQRRGWLGSAVVVLLCLASSTVALAINVYQLHKPVPATVNILSSSGLLPGDATGNGTVNASDLALVASAFNTSPPAITSADLNNDGIVDVYDLVIVGMNYGKSEQ